MKVLVTGASGFFGSHVAEQFFAAGHSVRLLLRTTSRREFLTFPYQEAVGDVTDASTLTAAVTGIDAIVHAAGLIKARHEAEFAAVNEQGTANLVRAAEEQAPGLKRFVYISSLAAHGPSANGAPRPVDAEPAPVSAYGRTKMAGEDITRISKLADRSVIFRMPVIYGPRDPALLPFFRAVKMRVAPLLSGGNKRISIVYAHDAARAVVEAVTAEANVGDRIYAPEDGAVYTWRDLLAAVEGAAGRKAVLLPVPKFGYQAGALATQAFGRAINRPMVFTLDKVREMAQEAWVCSAEDLRRDLGWNAAVQIEEGARLTYDWYREHGWL